MGNRRHDSVQSRQVSAQYCLGENYGWVQRNKFVPKEEGGGGGGNVTVTKKGREGGGALNVRLSPPPTPNVDSNSKSNIVG